MRGVCAGTTLLVVKVQTEQVLVLYVRVMMLSLDPGRSCNG